MCVLQTDTFFSAPNRFLTYKYKPEIHWIHKMYGKKQKKESFSVFIFTIFEYFFTRDFLSTF